MSLLQLALIGATVVVLAWGVIVYNGLVRRRNEIANAFAQIDVQFKRRHDLIPNLVETAKRYLQHEQGTLEAVAAARAGLPILSPSWLAIRASGDGLKRGGRQKRS